MWQTHVTGLLSPHAAASTCRSLYVSVITTIRGYGDYLWVDVVERVDAMGSQVGWVGLCRLPGPEPAGCFGVAGCRPLACALMRTSAAH